MLASCRFTPSARRSVASRSVTFSCAAGVLAPCARGANRASNSSRVTRPLAIRASRAVSIPTPASPRMAENSAVTVLAYSLNAMMRDAACASRNCRIATTRATSGSAAARNAPVRQRIARRSSSRAARSSASVLSEGEARIRIAGKPSCTASSAACHARVSLRVGARPSSAPCAIAVAIRRRARSAACNAARLDAHARTRPIARNAPASPPSRGRAGGGSASMARSTAPSSASSVSHSGSSTSGKSAPEISSPLIT